MNNRIKTLAIIPARKGSKRLPGKNIKNLAGKPLIQWTIDAARASQVFDFVCVSTDCNEIAEIAQRYGAVVPFLRPAELASDQASTAEVVNYFVSKFERHTHTSIDRVCLLQPTSPLRTAEHIMQADALYLQHGLDAVISVSKLEHPYQLCNTLTGDRSMQGFIDPAEIKRSQEYKVYYRLNGAIYLFNRDLAQDISRIYGYDIRSRALIMDSCSSIDIDTSLDFDIAEAIIKNAE